MEHKETSASFWKSPFGMICVVLAIATSLYLYLAHKDHLLALLPYALLALCPLMHLFMHRGDGHGGHTQGHEGARRDAGRP